MLAHIAASRGATGDTTPTTQQQRLPARVNEAQAFVDTLRIPPAIVERCRRDLTSLLSNIAEAEQGVVGASALSILSADGIAQVAGSLPRTVSELLRVDTMTVHKIHKYGHMIMDLLKNYWAEVDGK